MKKEARPFPHVLISHAAEDAPSLPVKASPLEATSGGTSARKWPEKPMRPLVHSTFLISV